jgi:hypothetical protein
MHNANAYPAYQYPNPDKSIALVPEQLIEYNKHLDRKNKNAAPEYAVWVKVTTSSPFTLLMTTISSLLYFFCNFLTRFFVAVLAISPSDS